MTAIARRVPFDYGSTNPFSPAADDLREAELNVGVWTTPAEQCSTCGAQLLVNQRGVKWCSAVACASLRTEQADGVR